tara:strand:- start:9043 stop:9261 length:219 start_codon:yes stop_codon:yes gene_type:complete
MPHNAQIWRVATSSVKSTKIANLPNPHNSIYEALRAADKKPELQKNPKGDKIAEWAVSDQVLQSLAAKHFGA